MSLFYKVSNKEMVNLRNDVFKKKGIPVLEKNGFFKSPFSTSWFGKDDIGGYTYEFCRISAEYNLEIIIVHIINGDRWVQIDLNIFMLSPKVRSIGELQGIDGLKFHLPPNSKTLKRLTPPDGIIFAGLPQHKVRFFLTEAGLHRRLRQLGDKIEDDLKKIDDYIKRWLAMHEPLVTDWNGNAMIS